jgi:hypothetical protein
MKAKPMKTLMKICVLIVLVCTLFYSTSFAESAIGQQQTDLVTLTVSSSCASVNVRLSTGEVLKTPFNKLLPRGQTVTLEALDATAPSCGGLQVVTGFRRLIVNNALLPKGQLSTEIALDKDTSVLLNYGADQPTVTLSGWTSCGRTAIRVIENHIGGQEGRLTTHFDLTLFQGQSIKLEAFSGISCGDTGSVLGFHHWNIGGKIYPEGQIAVDVTVEKYLTAVPYYSSFVVPYKSLTSFQILRNGIPVDFIREDDKLKKYTVVLTADNFPQGTIVFVSGMETEIISSSATQLEVKLLGKRAKQSGIISIIAIAPVNKYFTPATIEVRRE